MFKKTSNLILTISVLIIPMNVSAEGTDKSLSPYFMIKSGAENGVESFPLKSTSAEVKIAGVIADVKVTQVYKNDGNSPIEAMYVFPGSTRAAVYGMQMTIGERVRVAKIKEREEAKHTYEQAKAEGKSASLLEQHRPNVFQMSVANIMPKDEVKVELHYTELLSPTDGVYEFDYPTVVGPRYSNQKEETAPVSEQWIKNPFLHQGEAPTYGFGLSVKIDGSVPIEDLLSTSHKIETNFESPSRALVELSQDEKEGGNRDFILRYRLQGEVIQSGLILTESEGEKFFLLMAQPPKRVTQAQIPPRDYVFIIDVSGSMIGFPLEVTKTLMQNLLGQLKPTDTFNILLFSGGSQVFSPIPLAANAENLNLAIQLIDSQHGGGGTELLPAMQRALVLPQPEGVSRSFVIATDGYVQVEKEAMELVANSLNKANVFAFGIGTSVNRYIMEGLAHAGQGEPFIVTDAAEATSVVPKFKKYIESPVLTDISVSFDGFSTYDVEPQSIPDLFTERPLILFGKWKGELGGKIVISGLTGGDKYHLEIPVTEAVQSKDDSAIRYLWARHKIMRLSDYGKVDASAEIKKEITTLGLSYNLLTQYTSFVAVDDIVRNPSKELTPVKQPLPLPEGVSNSAVGSWGEIGTGPEPETWALMAVVGLMFLALAYKNGRKEFDVWM